MIKSGYKTILAVDNDGAADVTVGEPLDESPQVFKCIKVWADDANTRVVYLGGPEMAEDIENYAITLWPRDTQPYIFENQSLRDIFLAINVAGEKARFLAEG